MSKDRQNAKYKPKVKAKSVFDGSPTLLVNEYWMPKPYVQPVREVIADFKSGIPFNRAVDQVAAVYKDSVNRDKLAEHALKTIANEY